jgi:hypothetical protein
VRGERDEGQAAVELALVLPLVVLLLLIVVQVTLVARDQILVVHAARAGARAAAVGETAGGVRAAVLESAGPGGLKPDRLTAETSHIGGSDIVIVHVRYRPSTDVALVGALLPDVELRAKAAMRAETPP